MIGSKEYRHQSPGSWDELSKQQFIDIVSGNVLYLGIPIPALQVLLNLSDEESQWLLPADWYALSLQFPFLTDYSTISRWVVDSIELQDGRTCYPPSSDFDNVAWEEFVFADQLAQAGNWAAVAAVLYRPNKSDFAEDENPRIPFTRFGLNARIDQFLVLDKGLLRAVEVNYLALRRRMTDKYRYLFGGVSDGADSRTWIDTTREILGANVWNESQLATTSVNGVLAMIDNAIRTNQERQRHAKRK